MKKILYFSLVLIFSCAEGKSEPSKICYYKVGLIDEYIKNDDIGFLFLKEKQSITDDFYRGKVSFIPIIYDTAIYYGNRCASKIGIKSSDYFYVEEIDEKIYQNIYEKVSGAPYQ